MTRIIAGAHGGRRLRTPAGSGTRPTSDRVREALFSSLESELGGFDGVHVLDLFAGSGALGLEAVSRGAEAATLVDSDVRAVAAIKQNVRDLDTAGVQVVRSSAAAFVARAPVAGFDLVFLDPPYAMATEAVTALVRTVAEAVDGSPLFVVERSSRDPFAWPERVEGLRHKKYGETTLWYGR
jgi:16S rRNA (guanine966-N2)-methyltransferase